MRNITFCLLALLVPVCVLTVGLISGNVKAAPEVRKPELFSGLEKGQPVMLKELPTGYQITIIKGLQFNQGVVGGYTLTEIGSDFIVVETMGGVMQYRIPVYSLKSIIVTKVMGKNE
jgi:hypothetical protein